MKLFDRSTGSTDGANSFQPESWPADQLERGSCSSTLPPPRNVPPKRVFILFYFFYFENFLCPASFNIDTEINSLSLSPSPIFIKFIFEKGKSLNNKTKKRRPDAVPSFVATPLPALFHCSDFATDFQVCWDVVNCWSSTFFFLLFAFCATTDRQMATKKSCGWTHWTHTNGNKLLTLAICFSSSRPIYHCAAFYRQFLPTISTFPSNENSLKFA